MVSSQGLSEVQPLEKRIVVVPAPCRGGFAMFQLAKLHAISSLVKSSITSRCLDQPPAFVLHS